MSPLSVRERLDPRRACLVVVDMQNDFCDPDGAIYLGAYTAEEHASGLHNIGTYFGQTVEAAEVLTAWS